MKKNANKICGSLIGGAAGDALGYAVEFLSEDAIHSLCGESGITEYRLRGGLGRISDDTQMTLFTANGLLVADARGCIPGSQGACSGYIAQAYREWYKTQMQNYVHVNRKLITCWLMNVRGLYYNRAPGSTCMSAIDSGCCGTMEAPINRSKGCGGVMRVAPIGLYFDDRWTDLEVDRIGAEAAALTHGHEMGYIPAALLVHIVRYVSQRENADLKEAVLDGLAAMETLFPGAAHLAEFLALIHQAIAMAESEMKDLDAIHALGQGWVGDEALAIAIYCALKHVQDFDKALIASVNHGGDSDSTGAITGNILGAHLGLSRIPEKYTNSLELRDVILEIADDLCHGCGMDTGAESSGFKAAAWEKKYLLAAYGGDF